MSNQRWKVDNFAVAGNYTDMAGICMVGHVVRRELPSSLLEPYASAALDFGLHHTRVIVCLKSHTQSLIR